MGINKLIVKYIWKYKKKSKNSKDHLEEKYINKVVTLQVTKT